MSVHIPHTNSGICKAKVIPGWDCETDCARIIASSSDIDSIW